MNKIRILVISSDTDGVGYYRLLNPHSYINRDDIECDIRLGTDPSLDLSDEDYMKNFNIIIYNRHIPIRNQEQAMIFEGLLNKYNIKIIYDIDDYWILNSSHLNYNGWKNSKSQETIEKLLTISSAVTTTTPIFADRIKKLNNNVFVVENSLNINEYQWMVENKVPSDKIRFLWGGGISHMPDLRLLKKSFKSFDKDFIEKSQLYLCGFDLRIRTPKGIIKSNPNSNQWKFFEDIFTNNGKWVKNSEYRKFLNEYKDDNYGISEEFRNSEFYQRRWTKPILTYGTMYHESDVVLAPLKNNNIFNMYKSQLKVIEAGVYKCPIIASRYGPYTLDIEDGVDGFLIDEDKPHLWYDKMRWFVKNPSAVKDMGERLYEKVVSKYEMGVVTEKRVDCYKKILE